MTTVSIFGSVGLDLLSVVSSYPKADQKIRCLKSEVCIVMAI